MTRNAKIQLLLVSCLLFSLACGGPRIIPVGDAGSNTEVDAGRTDSGKTEPIDSGTIDSGTVTTTDSGVADSGIIVTRTGVRFVAFGDQGKGNSAQYAVGAAVGRVCAASGCDFVLLLGDNFYQSGPTSTTDPAWQTAFVLPYASVDAGFYVTLGNHDYGKDGQGTDFGSEQPELDYSAINPKWILPAHHYRFSAGDGEFFSADTNRSMLRKCRSSNPLCGGVNGDDSQVRNDFTSWLASSTAKWKIVFGHHCYLSNGKHGNAGNYDNLRFLPIANGDGVKQFDEDTVCGKADIYLNGHDHVREWISTTCTRNLADGGAGVNTEIITSGGGASVEGFQGAEMNPFHWHAASSGFFYGVVDGNTFTGSFYDADGGLEYTRTLTKQGR